MSIMTETRDNHEKAKSNFLLLVDHWLNNDKALNQHIFKLHSKEYIDKFIHGIIYNSKYKVVEKNEKRVLVINKSNGFDGFTQIPSWEEMFDLFMPLHVESGHERRESLKNMIGNEYIYPSMCLSFFKQVCNECNGSENILLPVIIKESLVYIINMVQMRSEEKFRYLLIYSDKATNFILLRPLIAKTDQEISLELFKIYTQFGPPKILYVHGYNSGLTKKIDENLQKLCPDFNVKIEHRPVSYELPTIVIDKMQEWMEKSKSDCWEVGCFMVQREMNNDSNMTPVGHEHHATPYSLYFNKHFATESNQKRSTEINISAEESTIFDQTKNAEQSIPNQGIGNFIDPLTLEKQFQFNGENGLCNGPEINEISQEPDIEQMSLCDFEEDMTEKPDFTVVDAGVQEDDDLYQNDEIIIS